LASASTPAPILASGSIPGVASAAAPANSSAPGAASVAGPSAAPTVAAAPALVAAASSAGSSLPYLIVPISLFVFMGFIMLLLRDRPREIKA
jgi:hypothetical protein